jgi:hypothetical protein
MRACMIVLTITVAGLAQQAPMAPGSQAPATIPSGVPLRVALESRVAIKRVGTPIHGRLVAPVYVYDRVALPAGSAIEGHVAQIGGVPAWTRVRAILSGNFTPPRQVRAEFDTVVLSDGSRLPLRTSPARGTAHTALIVTRPNQQGGPKPAPPNVRDRFAGADRAAILAFKTPGKMSRLKTYLLGMLPYHRQAWAAGTLFNGVLQEPLQEPLQAPAPSAPVEERAYALAAAGSDAGEVRARLLTPLSSATARRGMPVEAVVSQPQFSADHRLLIPEGSHLLGDVVEARPARFLHRNGKMLFVFREIKLPSGMVQTVQGYLEEVETDFAAHLTLDSEGSTHPSSPKTRFIFPAIAVAVAGLSLHQDYNAQGVPDQDIGGRAESGAVGLGLIGTFLAQASRPLASCIAFSGAGFSVYTNFIARGENVVLPANTPVEVSLRARGGEAHGR